MTVNVFAVPVFFVVFRETLETVVIVSVLLAWLKQTLDGPNADKVVYKKLVRQVCIHLFSFLPLILFIYYLSFILSSIQPANQSTNYSIHPSTHLNENSPIS